MKKPFHNTTAAPMSLGGVMIPAGTCVPIEEHLHPKPPAPPAEPETNEFAHLADLLKIPAKDIVAGIPDLTNDELAYMQALESDKTKPRATVLQAIAGEQLSRAQDPDAAVHDVKTKRLAELQEMTTEQLQAMKSNANDDDIALIDAAIALKEDAE